MSKQVNDLSEHENYLSDLNSPKCTVNSFQIIIVLLTLSFSYLCIHVLAVIYYVCILHVYLIMPKWIHRE